MNSSLISVIIPTYNRKFYVLNAINSVLKQTYKNIELIVIDDGSEDGTFEYLKDLNNKTYQLYRQENKGVSASRNFGVSKCRGTYITFLDSDDQWDHTKIEKQMLYHQQHPNLKISQTDEIWIRNGKRVNLKKKYLKSVGDIFNRSLELCTITPSSVFMSIDLFESYGGFDENLLACEDFDLWLQISSEHNIGLIKEPLITKYGGHLDQLSQKFPAMDRYRLYSLLKLIVKSSLNTKQIQDVQKSIFKKVEIIKAGAIKRGSDLTSLIQLVDNVLQEKLEYDQFVLIGKKVLLREEDYSFALEDKVKIKI